MTGPLWPGLLVGLLVISAAITAGMAVYAHWNRKRPGARWLAATLWATTIWTGTYAIGLLTHAHAWRPFWEHLQWVGTAFLPVFFLLFALEYTGHGRLVTKRTLLGLSVVPLITIALVWTNDAHQLMWIENRVVVQDGVATMVATYGPWFPVALLYSYALVLVGGGLLIWLLFASEYLYTDQAVLLGIGVTVPLVGNVLAVFISTPIPGLDLTPYGFAVWGIALFAVVYRKRLFALIPATQRLGRAGAVSQLDDGVIIVDDDKRVVYLNSTAASVFDCDATAAIGTDLESVVPNFAFDSGTDAELERQGRQYEVRTSPITDRRDRQIGYTLVVADVTERHRREQSLAEKRNELARVNELNDAIRGVNRALVEATNKDEVYESVCERFVDRELYETVCLADASTIMDETDQWTIAGERCEPPSLPSVQSVLDSTDPELTTVDDDTAPGTWTVVPISHNRTVYGVFCALSPSGRPPENEYDVLLELGELIGHALDALEHRQLLSAGSVVEVTLESHDSGAALAVASAQSGCYLALKGLVPPSDIAAVAFIEVRDGATDAAREALREVCDGPVQIVRDDDSGGGGLLSWTVDEDTLLGTLSTTSTNVTRVVADGGTAEYSVEMASDRNVRQSLDRIERSFPETAVRSKRQTERGVDLSLTDPQDEAVLTTLTERQEQMLKAAFQGGYFEWPRDSTAEEIAEAFDISAATFHGHLRKAEQSVFSELLEDEENGSK